MKISKTSNGRVFLLNNDDTIRYSIDPSWTLIITGATTPKVNDVIYATNGSSNSQIPIRPSSITATILDGIETPFSGNSYDLMEILSNDFFFKVSGGGTTDASEITSGTLSDERLSNNVAMKSDIAAGIGVTENRMENSYALTVRGYYNYVGSGNATWTLPSVTTNKGLFYRIYNKVGGSQGDNTGVLTLDANGSEKFFRSGQWSETIPLNFGENVTLQCDGLEWNVYG